MWLPKLITVLSAVTGVLAQKAPLRRRDDNPAPETAGNRTTVAPKRFILEFAQGTNAEAAAAEVANVRGAKVLRVFQSDIFSGVAVESEDENIDTLESIEPVSRAWQSKRIKLAPGAPSKTFSEEATAFNYSIHHMTGVDKLHAAGILGKGAKVAIVDTGVYYTHPALGGGIGPGFKIAGGYDLVGDGIWPEAGEKEPDTDPMDQQGHGTHVSGIIAGKSDIFTGVAPEATLFMYKVFSQIDGTDEDTLIDAFLMAYKEGADIITSSIGGLSGWSDGPWATVASRLVDQGVVVTISAGNDGQAGAYAASSGSSGEHVVAVASIEPDVLAVSSFKATFNLDGMSNATYVAYLSMQDWFPSEIQDWPIIPLNLDTFIENEACQPLPADTPDLSNVVVLIRRGGCNFSVKQQNLSPFNASFILFYSNEMPVVIPTTEETSSTIAMIQSEAGAAIINTIKAGGNVTADFTEAPIKHIVGVPNDEDGRAPSTFTSIGATNELFIKPDVAAPGGRILSTYLNNGYAILSGTSMACPYVAGVAALYIGKYGGRAVHGPKFAKSLAMRLISSGEAVRWDDGTGEGNDFGFLASVAQVGTGIVNASNVLDYTTSLSFAKFALNDTHHFSRYQSVDIENMGAAPVTYTFSSQAFGGMETVLTDTAYWGVPRIAWFEEVMAAPKTMVPAISYPGGTFTVKPGEIKTAKFSFKYPEGLTPANLPLYSGKVIISGSNGETLSVPYMGLAADLHKDIGIMFQSPIGFPTLTSLRSSVPISQKSNFTFDLATDIQDFPKLYTRMNYATTMLRWDIFNSGWTERDWKYPPAVGVAGFVGSVTSWAQASGKSFFNASSDDINDLISLPITGLPRDIAGVYGVELWWLGRLANGTQIAPGRYIMRFAALVPFGNPTASDNWDIFETPEFEVLPL